MTLGQELVQNVRSQERVRGDRWVILVCSIPVVRKGMLITV
jgi:hypothetical protein